MKCPRREYSVTVRKRHGVAGRVCGSSASRGRRGPIRAVRARLFRRLPRVDEMAWAAVDGWNSATVAECAHGRLRGRGSHPSGTAKSTALNAADSGHGGVSMRRGEIKSERGGCLGLPGHLPSSPLPSLPPLRPEPTAKNEKGRRRRGRERTLGATKLVFPHLPLSEAMADVQEPLP